MYKTILLLFLLPIILFSQQAKIMGGTNIKLQGNVKVKLYGDFQLNSSTFTQDGSNTFSLNGNWTNSGEYNANSAKVVFFGSNTQTITNISNNNFYDFEIAKTNNNVVLSNSSSITILNDLTFSSSTLGNLYTRDNGLVYVDGSVVRNTLGFVDGHLALNFTDNDATPRTFVIGREDYYTPIEVDFDGNNDVGGYVHAISNPRTLDMLGSQLDSTQNVERQYVLGLTNGSTFDLASGTFNMTLNYINPDDLRNGADPDNFVTARFVGPVWSQFLSSGTTTNSSVSSVMSSFGTYVVGPEDFFQNIYSTSSGSFSEAGNWSLYGYGSVYPSGFAPRSRDNAFIGDGDNITLDTDISILAGRTFTLEQAGPSGEQGQLTMDTYVLSGDGTFTLNSGGILSMGDIDGITLNPTNAGNIRTSTRDYNPSNHNNGNFIYTAIANGITGNGLPNEVNNLTIDSDAIITLESNVTVNNDLTISSGTFDIEDKIVTGTNNGEFIIADDTKIIIGDLNNAQISIPGFSQYSIDPNSTFEFNGSTQTISLLPLNFNTTLGYGNVLVNNIGTKTVASNLNIRGNLTIIGSAMFSNQSAVNDLRVLGNIYNRSSGFQNEGFIYIGP